MLGFGASYIRDLTVIYLHHILSDGSKWCHTELDFSRFPAFFRIIKNNLNHLVGVRCHWWIGFKESSTHQFNDGNVPQKRCWCRNWNILAEISQYHGSWYPLSSCIAKSSVCHKIAVHSTIPWLHYRRTTRLKRMGHYLQRTCVSIVAEFDRRISKVYYK